MNPEQLRNEILKLCEAFGAAAESRNKLVIDATASMIKSKVLKLIPDEIKVEEGA